MSALRSARAPRISSDAGRLLVAIDQQPLQPLSYYAQRLDLSPGAALDAARWLAFLGWLPAETPSRAIH